MTEVTTMNAPKTRMGFPWRAVVATAALALAGGVMQVAQAMPEGGMGRHGMGHHGMGPGGHGPMMGRALEAAGASAEQRAKIQEIMKAAREDVRKTHEASSDLRTQMRQLMNAATVDARAVEALRQKMLAQHDAVSKRMTQAMLDAAAVLTPEQRQKLSEQMGKGREMMQRHRREREQMYGPGPRQ
jgi:Spy/CpxP family protein refolding chaperone